MNIATHRGLPLVLFVQTFLKVGSSSQIQEEVHGDQDTTQEDPTGNITESIHGANEDRMMKAMRVLVITLPVNQQERSMRVQSTLA